LNPAIVSFLEIARRCEKKQGRAMVGLTQDAQPIADGWMTYDGPGAYANRAGGFGWTQDVTEEELDILVDFFVQRQVEPRVELSAFAKPELLDALARRRFSLQAVGNVLVKRLDEKVVRPENFVPGDIVIERVDPSDDDTVRAYVELSSSGFVREGAAVPPVQLALGIRAAKQPTYDGFIARYRGELIGGGGSESSDGLTSLFGTTVKREYRRRGVQQALIAARLQRGLERGSDLAVLVSMPGISTERNALRLGFVMAYSRLTLVQRSGVR
jgi:ribosomal protein S18 acetylase RimI-like enzyme